MKRLIAFICAVAVAVIFPFSAAAKSVSSSEHGVEIDFPDDYIVLTTGNLSKNGEFVESIGHSKESLRKAMNNGNIIFYAANQNNTKQLHVKSWTTDFSERIGELSGLGDESREATLQSIKNILVSDGHQVLFSNIFSHDNCLYLKLAVFVDGDNPFCYIQYITVTGGSFYSLVYYNAHGYLTVTEQKEADAVLSKMRIIAKSDGGGIGAVTVIEIVLILALIVAALVVMFLIIRSFIMDILGKRVEPEVIPDRIKIKRK